MAYTDPILEARRKQLLGDRYQAPQGSVMSGSQFDDFQRKRTQILESRPLPPILHSTPEVKIEKDETQNIFGKIGGFVKEKIFNTDDQILEKSASDLVLKISNSKDKGREAKLYQKALVKVEEAKLPEASKFKKRSTALAMRFLRTGDEINKGILGFASNILDVFTHYSEVGEQKEIERLDNLYEKTGNEDYKKTADAFRDIQNAEGSDFYTREYSNTLKKWAEDFETSDPSFAQKVVGGSTSMAGFTLLSYATGGNAIIPYLAESFMEASGVYTELREQGKSVEDSSQMADKALLANLIVNHYLNIFDDAWDQVRGIKKTIKGIAFEAVQEGFQQVVSNLGTGREWHEGVLEAMGIGGTLGGVVTVALPGQQQVVMDTNTNQVVVEETDGKKKILPDGEYDPQYVLDKILNSPLQGTKEGKELIKKATEAQNNGTKVIVGEIEKQVKPATPFPKQEIPQPAQTTQETMGEDTVLKRTFAVPTGVHLSNQPFYAELTPEQYEFLFGETKNIDWKKDEDRVHLTPLSTLEDKKIPYQREKVSIEEMRKMSPELDKALRKLEETSTENQKEPVKEPKVEKKNDVVEPKIKEAKELGKKAFEEGKKVIPASDPELMNLIKGLDVGESSNILKAWTDSWHQANLAEETPKTEPAPRKQEKPENIDPELNKTFRHHSWFIGGDYTIAKALDYFAQTNDFVLDKRLAKKQGSNIMDDYIYDDVIRFTGKEKGTYKFKSEKEKAYYLKRKEFYTKQKEAETKPKTEDKKVEPEVKKKPAKSKKQVASKPTEEINAQKVNEYLKINYNKSLETATKKQLTEAFSHTKTYIPFNEKVFKRGSSVGGAFSFSELQMRPTLLYGGKDIGVFTDGFVLVLDKKLADKINEKNIKRGEDKFVKSWMEDRPDNLSFAEAEKTARKVAKEFTKDAQKDNYPPYKKIIPATKGKLFNKVAITSVAKDALGVVLLNNNTQVYLNADKVRLFEQNFDNVTYRSEAVGADGAFKPVMVFSKDKMVGLIMPFRIENPIDVKELKTKKPSGLADAGSEYADLQGMSDDLIKEAQKYKSAEEFVNSQPKVFHGSDTKIDKFDLNKVGTNTDSGMFGEGIYFSGSKSEASTYARKTGNVDEYVLDLKNPLIIKSQADIPDIQATGTKDYSKKFTKYLQDRGYDGVIDEISPNKQYVVFNPEQIKTKSQLTDIWNKANKPFIPEADSVQYADESIDSNYADVKSTKKTVKDINIVEMPELVRIAKNILGNEISLRKFRKLGQRGVFNAGNTQASIELHPDVFKDPVLVAKVLAHEMGHMTDWMDSKNIKRGNLVSRIASLNGFLKSTFSNQENLVKQEALEEQSKELTARRRNTESGSRENKLLLSEIKKVNKQIKALKNKSTINDKEIRQELKDLTMLWKPFDPSADPNFTKYRFSSVELYADAISVLFNDPSLLKQKAPKFWDAFFENIDNKPQMSKELFDTWDLLTQGSEAKQDQRSKDVRDMFKKGEDKFLAMTKEKKAREESYAFKLKYEYIDKNQRIIDKVNKKIKEGVAVADDQNPVYLLEEHNYSGGVVKNWVEKNIQPIHEKLRNNDLSWDDLGEILFHERVVNERGAVKNPLKHIQEVSPEMFSSIEGDIPSGLMDKSATTQLKWLKSKYGELREGGTGRSYYDDLVATLPLSIANPLGFDVKTSKEQLEFLKKQHGERWEVLNDILGDFRSVMNGIVELSAKNKFYKPELIELMKSNPAYSTFQVIEYLDTNVSAKIGHQVGTLKEVANPAQATIMKAISTIRAIERNNVKKGIVDFLKENYIEEVEPAKTVWTGKTRIPIETKESGKKLFTVIEDGVVKGYYIDEYIAKSMEFSSTGQTNAVVGILKLVNNKMFRPLFITFNTGFQTFNLLRDFSRFYKNTPNMSLLRAVQRYAQAVPHAYRRAFGKADKLISQMEESKMLSITYNDVIQGITDVDKQIDVILAKTGVTEMKKRGSRLTKPFLKVLDAIEKTGNMVESIPKVAGYKQLNGKMPSKKLASFIRTSIGSPDFLRRGASYAWTNEVFLFSNAIKEGIRADVNIATNPKTRSGYWWKTAQMTLLPKAIMFSALLGLFGDELKKMFEDVSEYDKTNYTIIPLGEDENNRTIYVRIPQDETGRLIGGLFWKGMRIINSEQASGSDFLDLISYAGGQVPSLNPLLTSLYGIATFASGKNPYDFFRGRNVIPDSEFEAGGKYALKPFVIWQLNNLGLGTIWKTYYSTQPPASKTWLQKTLDLPLVSNIVGRWIKVSDYGQTEKNRELVGGEKKSKATARLEEKELVNDAIEKYKSGEEKDLTKLTYEIMDELSVEKQDIKTKRRAILKKLKVGIRKGENATTDALIYSTTNDEKVIILQNKMESMAKEEFKSYIGVLVKEGIISKNVYREVLSGNN